MGHFHEMLLYFEQLLSVDEQNIAQTVFVCLIAYKSCCHSP